MPWYIVPVFSGAVAVHDVITMFFVDVLPEAVVSGVTDGIVCRLKPSI